MSNFKNSELYVKSCLISTVGKDLYSSIIYHMYHCRDIQREDKSNCKVDVLISQLFEIMGSPSPPF